MKKLFTLVFATMAVLSSFAKTDAPKGAVQYYTRTGGSIMYDWDGLFFSQQKGCVGVVVEGKDVYIQNLLSDINNDMWVKGTLGDDGKTVTIPQDNVVQETSTWVEYPSGDWGEVFGVLRFSMVTLTVDGEEATFTRDTETPIQLLMEENTITLLNTDSTRTMLGTVYDGFEDESLNGKYHMGADYNTVFTKFNEQPVTVPVGAECAEFVMKYYEAYSEEPSYSFVKFYTAGNDVYVAGFYSLDKNMAFKCTRQGSSLHFDSPQFTGICAGYINEMVAANYSTTEPDEWGWSDLSFKDTTSVDFSYSEANGTYSLKKGQTLRLTVRGSEDVNTCMYRDLEIYPYVDELLTPKTPTVQDVADYYDLEGDWDVYFECPTTSVDNKPLNPNNLYFCFYVNDKLYTFDAERYGLEDDMVYVPYTLTGNEYLNKQTFFGIHNYIQEKTIWKVGVQLVYRVGDEESRSEIDECELESGIRDIETDANASVRYDIMGNRVGASHHGLVIVNGKKMLQK